jgi:Protein of unknown function TPD sequence-motif
MSSNAATSNNNEMKKESSPSPSSPRKRNRGGGGGSGSSNSNNHHQHHRNKKSNHRRRGRSRRSAKPEENVNDNNRRSIHTDKRRSSSNSDQHDDRPSIDDDDDDDDDDGERKPAAAVSDASAAAASTVVAAPAEQQGQQADNNDDDDDEYGPPQKWLLQCQTVPKNGEGNASQQLQQLWWYSPALPTTLAQEQAILPKLLRWQQKERGMMKTQPPWRVQDIVHTCRHTIRMPLDQALSLRRHHMKRLNPTRRMPALGLGQEDDIRESARLFEEAVADCLRRQNVAFYSELDQKRHYEQQQNNNSKDVKGPPLPATPDFLLKHPVVVTKYYHGNNNNNNNNNKRIVIDEPRQINWLEAKMFYGACSIPEDNVSAVGRILPTARKYTKYFGPGAFVFMHGCGESLVCDLARVGVVALDCCSGGGSSSRSSSNSHHYRNNNGDGMVNLRAVLAHQQTWCADAHGNILP